MTYLVSARRWRPQTFEDLVGQEHVSRTLSNAIRAGRVAHAFLFTGVRGVGKTTAARVLAKALNCERGPTPTPCNACVNCNEITAGRAVDVLEIDGASNTGVDDVREIIENVRYQAAKSRFKIYIIDEVHMLSNSAFNALLKTLEEPPPHVKFIFATTDPHKLPATVQSRCQRYDFRRIGLRQVVTRLRQIAEADGLQIGDGALFALAREGEGSMRDAQSLLDQVLAGADGPITEQQVYDTLGVADRATITRIAEAIIARDATAVLTPLDEAYRRGCDVRRFTRDLLEHFRDLAVAKVGQSALLPEVADEELALLRAQAERISAVDCDRAFRILIATDDEVARSPYPKLVLEMALLKLTILPPLLAVDALLERLDGLEAHLRGGGGRRTEAVPRESAPPQVAAQSGAAQTSRLEPDAWQGFLTFATEQRPVLADHLAKCTLVQLEGAAAVLAAARGFRFDYLSRREHLTQVEDLATRYFGRPVRVQVQATEVANGGSAETGKADGAALANAALENPAVKAAVELLGGEVAEVRQRQARRRREE